jgi:hypothetical protein
MSPCARVCVHVGDSARGTGERLASHVPRRSSTAAGSRQRRPSPWRAGTPWPMTDTGTHASISVCLHCGDGFKPARLHLGAGGGRSERADVRETLRARQRPAQSSHIIALGERVEDQEDDEVVADDLAVIEDAVCAANSVRNASMPSVPACARRRTDVPRADGRVDAEGEREAAVAGGDTRDIRVVLALAVDLEGRQGAGLLGGLRTCGARVSNGARRVRARR